MDGEAWWAAVHAVAQSRTRLKRLSSSSMIQLGVQRFPLLNVSSSKGKRGGERAGGAKEASKNRENKVEGFWVWLFFLVPNSVYLRYN